jgi:hypothetical protein
MKLDNLTGKKFGRLLIGERFSPIGTKHIDWHAVCDCGTIKVVNGQGVKKGSIRSCGCLRRDFGTWNKGLVGPASHAFGGTGEVPLSYFNELKYKARGREIGWSVTIAQLAELYEMQNRRCAISGIDIVMPHTRNVVPNCASLDRIDSEGAYVIGNVQWVDRRINFMKQCMSDSDFIKLCKIVAAHNA